jgi:hypothetical protein
MEDDIYGPDDHWNRPDARRAWVHPAMRMRPDTNGRRPPGDIKAQEALRAQLNKVRLLSKTQAVVGGQTVTLNQFTGELSCTCALSIDNPDCRHVVAVREQALKRIRR